MMSYLKVSLFLLLFLRSSIFAQQIDFGNLKSQKPLKFSGGISARSVLYSGDANRLPFSYIFAGNLGVQLFGYNVPLNFTYSNQQLNYSQPINFNKFSFHPNYKWIQLHLGSHSMNFSPYTLSGHQFSGVAVDLAPGNAWKFSAMYGQLLKAVALIPDSITNPTFKRTGYGFKTGYEKNGFHIEAMLFASSDDPNSINISADTLGLLVPEQNVTFGFKGQVSPIKKIQLMAEYASSIINSNPVYWESNAMALLKNSEHFNQYSAYKVALGVTPGKWTFSAKFEHIDPNYRTLGGYYFNNDLENLTLNTAVGLCDGKLNLAINGGVQFDDLEQQKKSKSTRIVGSFNSVFTPSEKWSVNFNYSNFQSFTHIKSQFDYINQVTPYDNLDTLDFSQLTQSATLTINHQLKASEVQRQFCGLSVSFQDVASLDDGLQNSGNGSFFVNSNANWGWTKKNGFNWNVCLNGTFNSVDVDQSFTLGPMTTISKSFLEKRLRTSASIAWNQSYINRLLQMRNLTTRLSTNYTLKKCHRFNFSITAINRFANDVWIKNLTTTLGYAYSF